MTTESESVSASAILQNHLWFPVILRPEHQITFVECSETTFSESHFLDQSRIKGLTGRQVTVKVEDIEKAVVANIPKISHLFHISHVGSTLMAKVLDQIDRFTVLREPSIFRDIRVNFDSISDGCSFYSSSDLGKINQLVLKLLARGPQEHTVIKHTSINTHFIDMILTDEEQPAIALYTSLGNFVCHALSSIGAQSDIFASIQLRLKLINRSCLGPRLNLEELDFIQMAGLVWLCSMHRLCTARVKYKNLQLLNFDTAMKDRESLIQTLIQGFDLDLSDKEVSKLNDSPVWMKSSKASANFDPESRMQKITSNMQKHETQMRKLQEFILSLCESNHGYYPVKEYV
jgi:hypothetical protein